MKFNLDIVQSYLRAFLPYTNCPPDPALTLARFCTDVPAGQKDIEALYLVDAETLDAETAHNYDGLSVLLLNAGPMHAVTHASQKIHTFYDADRHEKPGQNDPSDSVPSHPIHNRAYFYDIDDTKIPVTNTCEGTAIHWSEFLPDSTHFVALEKKSSLTQIMLELMRMITEINTWSTTILTALAQREPLPEIFKFAQTIFANPLMLSNSAMEYWSIAGSLPENFCDTVWTPALKEGYCPLENYYHIWCESTEDPFSYNHAFIVKGKPLSTHNYLFRNLSDNERYYGSFELIDAFEPFTGADLAFAECLGDAVSTALHSEYGGQICSSSKAPLLDLLEGKEVQDDIVEFALNMLNWNAQDPYRVIMSEHHGAFNNHPSAKIQARKRVQRAFPYAVIFDGPDGFYSILRECDHPATSDEDIENELREIFAPPFSMNIGISSTMTDFHNLPAALKQAKYAIGRARTKYQMDGLADSEKFVSAVHFDDYYFDAFVETLEASDFRVMLDIAPVSVLLRSDLTSGTEYVNTIVAYFENGFNIHDTAETLHIHRNTLSYRLKRIKHLSGIDCETPSQSVADPLRVYIACRAHKAAMKAEAEAQPLNQTLVQTDTETPTRTRSVPSHKADRGSKA